MQSLLNAFIFNSRLECGAHQRMTKQLYSLVLLPAMTVFWFICKWQAWQAPLEGCPFFFLRIQLHFPWWSWVCNAVYLCKFFPLQFLLINDLNVLTQLLPSSAFGLHFVILVKMHPWQKHRSCFSAWTAHFHHSETLVMEFRKCCSQEIVMTCPMMEKDSVRWCQRKMHSCAPQEGFQDKRRGVNHGTLPWSHHLLFWEWKESKPTPFTFFTGLSH